MRHFSQRRGERGGATEQRFVSGETDPPASRKLTGEETLPEQLSKGGCRRRDDPYSSGGQHPAEAIASKPSVTVFHEKGPPVKGRLVTPLRSRLGQIVIRALYQSSIRTLSGLR